MSLVVIGSYPCPGVILWKNMNIHMLQIICFAIQNYEGLVVWWSKLTFSTSSRRWLMNFRRVSPGTWPVIGGERVTWPQYSSLIGPGNLTLGHLGGSLIEYDAPHGKLILSMMTSYGSMKRSIIIIGNNSISGWLITETETLDASWLLHSCIILASNEIYRSIIHI